MPINDAPSLLGAGSQGTTSLLNGGERRFPFSPWRHPRGTEGPFHHLAMEFSPGVSTPDASPSGRVLPASAVWEDADLGASGHMHRPPTNALNTSISDSQNQRSQGSEEDPSPSSPVLRRDGTPLRSSFRDPSVCLRLETLPATLPTHLPAEIVLLQHRSSSVLSNRRI